ncbi:LysR family transcriptional regulator [Chelatococcus sp. GCM10030263]|uniref:LysR family transcriptional regulator n=1 Tax=Chelatococcus sp. GCM10030263 TaxID=3273387 RepID=UPI00361F65D5
MELRQLQHFVAVAEEQHFTRAAQRVNIVQSALSSSIRALEEELDAKLFVRSTRQVRLTAAGCVFLDKARIALEAVRDARDSVAALQGLKRGSLSIGTVQSLPAFLDLPAHLARFHAEYPEVEVRLCQGSTSHLLEKVQTGRLDLAILPMCEPSNGITTLMIACEALVVICAPAHPLAGRTNVPLAAVAGEPFVDFERAWGTRQLVDRGFAETGLQRHIAFEVSDLDTLIGLVARGLGVALVPEAVAEARRSCVGIAELAEPEMCWELVVAYVSADKGQSGPADPAPRAFLNLLDGAMRPLEAAAE